jgi:SOS-response transcriptional repressor LexA
MATLKQKKIVKKISENIRNTGITKTLQELAEDSGYSKSIAKTPGRILKGQGVIELFEKSGITRETLAGKYKELLNMPLKEESISADTRRKTLEDLSKRLIDTKENELSNVIKYGGRFIKREYLLELNKEIPQETTQEAEIRE